MNVVLFVTLVWEMWCTLTNLLFLSAQVNHKYIAMAKIKKKKRKNCKERNIYVIFYSLFEYLYPLSLSSVCLSLVLFLHIFKCTCMFLCIIFIPFVKENIVFYICCFLCYQKPVKYSKTLPHSYLCTIIISSTINVLVYLYVWTGASLNT